MPASVLKICSLGHKFYKTSDCPACPVCAANNKPQTGFLSLLSAPAKRALEAQRITTLKELANHTEKQILALHGIGKTTMPVLKRALNNEGLMFKE